MSGFAEELKKLRKERGLTQADLARTLGLAQTTIANYEQGSRFPDEEVLNALADHFHTGMDVLLGRKSGEAIVFSTGKNLSGLGDEARTFLELLLSGDFGNQARFIRELQDKGWEIQALYEDLFTPAMIEAGRLWASGMLEVYQEHRMSADVQRHLAQVAAPRNPQSGRGRFMAFAVSGELHELGLRMACDLMNLAGWESWFLGVNVPPSSVLAAVRDFRPRILGISASLESHVGIAEQTIQYLKSAFSETSAVMMPRIILGGQAFRGDPGLARRIGADALAENASRLPEIALELTR